AADATHSSDSSASAPSPLKPADRRFLTKAAENDRHEVALAELAVQKAENAEVRSFAQKILLDHQKLKRELLTLGGRKGVALDASGSDRGRSNTSGNSSDSDDTSDARQSP